MAEDILRMQQEAAYRVKRMQERSRQVFEEQQKRTAVQDATVRYPSFSSAASGEETEKNASLSASDSDRWLLLGLAFLLFRNDCPLELTVALLYLLL